MSLGVLKKKNFSRRGMVLAEAIVALSVLTVGFLGMFALLSSALSANKLIAENYIATYLAAEGIEVVKNILDSGVINELPWPSPLIEGNFEVEYKSSSLIPVFGSGRFILLSGGVYGYSEGSPTPFRRIIRIDFLPNIGLVREVQVNSVVSWTGRGGGIFEVNLEDHFLDWRP